ncbi:MAG: hypothetical protein J1E41_03075 [Ruminococcus sp.]|nr:hypothetical protein [Ruminococcus sp.]
MLKKLYVSPEFEWLYIDLLEDVLSASNPDIEQDTNDMETPPSSSDPDDGNYGEDEGDIDDIF